MSGIRVNRTPDQLQKMDSSLAVKQKKSSRNDVPQRIKPLPYAEIVPPGSYPLFFQATYNENNLSAPGDAVDVACHLPLPLLAADNDNTLVVTAAPPETGLNELDTPAALSVVSGDDMRQAAPRVNLSENLSSVPGLQIQNRQNYAQDLQLSMRGFGSRSTYGVRGLRIYVDGIPATMPDGQAQTSQYRYRLN
ncbi:Colicin I receptor precursor [Pantoea agglomerans]|uniref:Colicin I receptor n=1 Tax=Enterobacter agglomerans TaxID=549 RepID=A0A379AG33_ENTAG|nr:Colicin I receptor precursor [Pantoea agglomerans]